MSALLYAHRNVYLDTGRLQSTGIVPREGYYRYLQSWSKAASAKRIMFGSDCPIPNQIEAGIDAIMAADFLSAEQKADILCNNTAHFLRLNPGICEPH